MKYDERLRRDQAVARLEANTRRIAADVPVTVTPDDMANEYHWKNPHMVRDGSRFADPAVVEAYAKIADLRERLAAAERALADALAIVKADTAAREYHAGLLARATAAEAVCEDLKDALHSIKSWTEAYPLALFPEPDMRRAREVLEANGMTLDGVTAYAMRHVVTQLAKDCAAALATYDARETGRLNKEQP